MLVVPKLKKNQLTVSEIARDNCCTIEFDESSFVVKDKMTGTQIAKGARRGDIYALKMDNLLALSATRSSSDIWHARLGHPNSKSLEVLRNNKCINFTYWNKTPTVCVSCQMGKGYKLPFQLRNKVEVEPLLKIHCDLWGPNLVESSTYEVLCIIY